VAETLGSLCTLPRGLLWRRRWLLGLWVCLHFFLINFRNFWITSLPSN
jgi:hypothetical protein